MAFSDGTADFRSDTVTQPTPEMRTAMAEAPVGDDVYGDDPTVNALEEEAAAVVGKEAGVFVPTGTMGNQLAVLVQTSPGEEVLVDEQAHIRSLERGWGPAHAGVAWRTVVTDGGQILPEQLDLVMETAGGMFPRIGLMAWENTHNLSGGRVIPLEVMQKTSERARAHGLKVHMDGARVFNAVAATGVAADEFSACVDTIQFCFSKGLGAPIGSITCGPADLMAEVRYVRKRLGGGMRQVGVIAAAARIALRDRARLVEDHELARDLAAGVADRWPGSVDLAGVESNIVNVTISALDRDLDSLRLALTEAGILTNGAIGRVWRLVTHRDVDKADVDRLLATLDTVGS